EGQSLDDFSEQLIERYFDRVHAYVRLRAPRQDCEDLVGDIFLRAFERRSQLRGDVGAWLFSIARSRIADYYRQKRDPGREPLMPIESQTADTADGAQPTAKSTVPPASARSLEPLQKLERTEFNERLLRNINRLNELERDVIALKFTDGLSNVEIAEMLKIT